MQLKLILELTSFNPCNLNSSSFSLHLSTERFNWGKRSFQGLINCSTSHKKGLPLTLISPCLCLVYGMATQVIALLRFADVLTHAVFVFVGNFDIFINTDYEGTSCTIK